MACSRRSLVCNSPPLDSVNLMEALHAWVGHHQLDNYSESAIGWIFSIHAFFLYIGSRQLGKPSYATQTTFLLPHAHRPLDRFGI